MQSVIGFASIGRGDRGRWLSGAMLLAAAALVTVRAEAQAQTPPARAVVAPTAQAAPAAKPKRSGNASSPLGGLGGDSKEPIKIDADKLDVLDKENRAVFSGNVVAVQGETTVRCTVMTVFYEGRSGQTGAASARTSTPPPAATPAADGKTSNDSSIKRIECTGPVTVVSKTQAATSDHAIFDRANNKVIMTGNVALNDGPNITRGEKLVYDTQTGVANVENSKGRVQGFFVPSSGDAAKTDAGKAKPPAGRTPAPPTN